MSNVLLNILWLILDKVFKVVAFLGVTIWLARSLGPEKFGVLSIALALVEIIRSIAAFGMQGPLVRDLSINKKNESGILTNGIVLQAIFAFMGMILCILFYYIYRSDNFLMAYSVLVLSLTLLVLPISVFKYYFEANIQSKFTVKVSIISKSIAYGGLVCLLYFESTYSSLVPMLAFEYFLGATLLTIFFLKANVTVNISFLSISKIKEYFLECWPLALSAASVVIYMKVDTIMVGGLHSSEMAGEYSAAVRISEAIYFIPMAITATVFPILYKIAEKKSDIYERSIQMLYDIFTIMAMILIGIFWIYGDSIVTALYGDKYIHSGGILKLHAFSSIFMFWGYVNHRWLLREGYSGVIFTRTALGCLINVAINYLLIPKMGGEGAAIATIISYACVAFLFDVFLPATRALMVQKIRSCLPITWMHSIKFFVINFLIGINEDKKRVNL